MFDSQVDTARLLLEQPIFQGLSLQDARYFADICDTVRLQEGSQLFREGDEAREIFLTLSGRLQLSCIGASGDAVVVGTVSDGGVLGEMGVFDDAPRSATATALMPSLLLRVPREVFAALVEQGHPLVRSLLLRLRQLLCWRLRALDRRLDAALSPYVVGEMALVGANAPAGLGAGIVLEEHDRLSANDLLQVPVLHRLDERAREVLAGVISRRAFADGDLILSQGASADGVCLLLRGQVRVVRRLPMQGSVRLVTLGPGAVFGILSALDGLTRAADCTADGEVECGVLSLADFSTLMDGEAPTALRFQMAMLHALFTDLRRANARLAEMADLPELDLGVAMMRPLDDEDRDKA